jgi:hypothetical protein
MKELLLKLNLIFSLARRGAWYGVYRFSGSLFYALTHRKCRQCGEVKGYSAHSCCVGCRYKNLMNVLYSNEYDDN